MPFKKTLNPKNIDFPMKANLVNNANFFEEFWTKNKTWEKICKRDSKLYILHDGPPYANGNIHIGHALNKILKDFVLRYKAISGYRLNYIPGWDTHGLPIENQIEKLGFENKRKSCKEYVIQQIENQKKQFKRLHLLTDFKEIYRTLDKELIDKELLTLFDFFKKELIYWEKKPVAWSWSSKTALAESEIIYKDVECESIYFWFPIVEGSIPKGTRLLIWTTTPYTLEGNLAIAVNPDLDYELIENKGDLYLIVKGKAEEINLEGIKKKTIKGKEIINSQYFNPITNEQLPVIMADYVKDSEGTGLVHNASGYGLEDYYACKENQIGIYCSIDEKGHFLENTKFPNINGLFYLDANKVVINWLEEKGYLFKKRNITHSVGHDWRTEKPIMYRASPQWFLDISKLKEKIIGFSSVIKSNPEWLSKKLETVILSRKEWCLSRQRKWGTPIPILFDGEEPIMDLEQIEHTLDLLREHGVESWFDKDPLFFLHKKINPRKNIKKSEEILDVWFDSGCTWNLLKEPADLYLEGFDQIRGWFNSSATIAIAKIGVAPFKQLLAHGFVLDGKGNKMSKSKGNVVDPIEIIEKYGADVLRLWLGSNNFLEDIKISQENLDQAIATYRKIRNTIFKYSLAVIPKDFLGNKEIIKNLKLPENIYIWNLFQQYLAAIKKHLDNFEFFKAIKENMKFINIYSSWYLEICKDTIYCESPNSDEYIEAISIIYEIFKINTIFWSIFIPQTSEEAYKYLNIENKKESINLEIIDWKTRGGKIERFWDSFFSLKDRVYEKIEILKNAGKVSGSTEVCVIMPEINELKNLNLVKLLNVAEIEPGEEISVKKSNLFKCLRCRRNKGDVNEKNLCKRCDLIIKSAN